MRKKKHIQNNVSPPIMNNPNKNTSRAKKGKYTMKHLDTIYSSNIQKYPPNYKNPLQMSECTSPFCDRMPMGNQNPSSKGGGGGDHLKCSRSTRRAWISSS